MPNTARIAKNTIFLYLRMIGCKVRRKNEEVRSFCAADLLPFPFLILPLPLIVGFVTLFTLLNGAMMLVVTRMK